LFLDKQGGGYFNTPGEDPSVLLHIKEDYDGAEPSGNSVAAINLIRLASMFDAEKSFGCKRIVEHLLVCFYSMTWFWFNALHSSGRLMSWHSHMV
jgi:uncharacterized protein YyaL (SSP411 family)